MFLSCFIIAMFITMILIPPLIRLAAPLRLVDMPDERKVHKQVIPRIGGLAIVLGAWLPLIFLAPRDEPVLGVFIGSAIILLFGVWDDRADLGYGIKFAGQLIAILTMVLLSDVLIYQIPFFTDSPLPYWLALPFTVFALLGITNAVNLSDGLDGLAGGASLLSLVVIAIIGFQTSQELIALSAFAIMGAILGFLRFNTHPARIFMGDSGSQFLGFSLGSLSILLTQSETVPVSIALPCFILGLPVLDTVWVMVRRISKGLSPFKADKNHFHHRLLDLGLNHNEVVIVLYVIQLISVTAAYYLRYELDSVVAICYLVFVTSIVFLLAKLESYKRDGFGMSAGVYISAFKFVRAKKLDNLTNAINVLGIVCVALYLFLSALFVENIPRDLSVLPQGLLVGLLIAWYLLGKHELHSGERIALYVIGSLVVFLSPDISSNYPVLGQFLNICLILTAIMVIIGFKITKNFPISSLDVLMLSVCLILPFVAAHHIGQLQPEMLIKTVILFYSFEYLLSQYAGSWHAVRAFQVGLLLVILS